MYVHLGKPHISLGRANFALSDYIAREDVHHIWKPIHQYEHISLFSE